MSSCPNNRGNGLKLGRSSSSTRSPAPQQAQPHEHERKLELERSHAHSHGHSHTSAARQRQPQPRSSSGPSWTRIIVVVTMMVLFMIPTVWLWQEAVKVQEAKEESMRQYVEAMAKIRNGQERRAQAIPEQGREQSAGLQSGVADSTNPKTVWEFDKAQGLVHIRDGGDLYDRIVSPRSWDAPYANGPNGDSVVWAVFFYKPYCGACRRIRPTVEALAATVADWLHLRFAAVDCVKHSYFCTALQADDTPVIHLFKYDPSIGKRSIAASWRGMLVSYAVTNWLKAQQSTLPTWASLSESGATYSADTLTSTNSAPILSPLIHWPSEDALAEELIAYKRRRQSSFNEKLGSQSERVGARPLEPSAYLTDIKSALHFGLVDYIFPSRISDGQILTGRRLLVLLRWLDACAAGFPGAQERRHIRKLRRLLAERSEWQPGAYHATLAAWGHNSTLGIDDDVSWRACRIGGARPGVDGHLDSSEDGAVGGYPCALWMLFHTLLANARPANAYEVLMAIVQWVEEFFGCRECARHFANVWAKEGITEDHHNLQPESQRQIHAAMWLWQAHNLVRARLHAEAQGMGVDSGQSKWQFPSVWGDCHACYTPAAQEEWQAFVEGTAVTSQDQRSVVEYDSLATNGQLGPIAVPFGYRFEDTKPKFETMTVYTFLQELYCFGSDTLTCAQFYDPAEELPTDESTRWDRGHGEVFNLLHWLRTLTPGRILTWSVYLIFGSFAVSLCCMCYIELTNEEIEEYEQMLAAEDAHRNKMKSLVQELSLTYNHVHSPRAKSRRGSNSARRWPGSNSPHGRRRSKQHSYAENAESFELPGEDGLNIQKAIEASPASSEASEFESDNWKIQAASRTTLPAQDTDSDNSTSGTCSIREDGGESSVGEVCLRSGDRRRRTQGVRKRPPALDVDGDESDCDELPKHLNNRFGTRPSPLASPVLEQAQDIARRRGWNTSSVTSTTLRRRKGRNQSEAIALAAEAAASLRRRLQNSQ